MIDRRDRPESALAALAKDPIDAIDRADPMLPTERTDPMLPMDSAEPSE